jgi:hypothetical protein
MTASLAHPVLGRDIRAAALSLAVVLLLATVELLLATVASAAGDAPAPVDTLAPAAPGWSPDRRSPDRRSPDPPQTRPAADPTRRRPDPPQTRPAGDPTRRRPDPPETVAS